MILPDKEIQILEELRDDCMVQVVKMYVEVEELQSQITDSQDKDALIWAKIPARIETRTKWMKYVNTLDYLLGRVKREDLA